MLAYNEINEIIIWCTLPNSKRFWWIEIAEAEIDFCEYIDTNSLWFLSVFYEANSKFFKVCPVLHLQK